MMLMNFNFNFLRTWYILLTAVLTLVYWNYSSYSTSLAPIRDGWKLVFSTFLFDLAYLPLIYFSFKLNRLILLPLSFLIIINLIGFSGGSPEIGVEIGMGVCLIFIFFLLLLKSNKSAK